MRKFSGFAVISGIGWLIDLGVTVLLVAAGMMPFAASVTGSVCAVSYVFVISQLMVFETGRQVRYEHYGRYMIWHALTIPVASGLVAALGSQLVGVAGMIGAYASGGLDAVAIATGMAKVMITPVTLVANFLFMRWLVEDRR